MSRDNEQPTWQLHCPVPIAADAERVTLAHGEGGRLMRQLIRDRIITQLGSATLRTMDDAAQLAKVDGRLAATTDSFVVSPLFFPGGDIGSLAVFGTVNDLAVSGAQPLYLTLSLILEEGLPLELLDSVLESVAQAASTARVEIVAGDTKVVPRGAVDGLFINTTGIGALVEPVPPGPTGLREGDELIVSGSIGRHGIAVLCAREELGLEPPPASDCAPLVAACEVLRERLGSRLQAMRDATRGGVAAVLHEWAEASGLTMTIAEDGLPVTPDIRGACELLGLDPLHIANEGTMVVAVAPDGAEEAVAALRTLPQTSGAARMGSITARQIAPVTVRRLLGSQQPLDDPLGAPLPRIC